MIAALFLLSAPQVAPKGLPADARLDRPLAIEARIEPLPVLLKRVGKDLGLTLTVERRMEGLKTTIFTPARPARVTLVGLASVFDAEWVARSGGYRLQETVSARNRRETYLDLETRALREAAEAYLTGPFQEPDLPPGGPLTDEQRQRIIDSEAATYRQISAIYRSFPPRTRERFWAGEPVFGGTGSDLARPSSLGVAQFRAESREMAFAAAVPGRHTTFVRQVLSDEKAATLQASAFQKAQRAWGLDPQGEWPREFDRPLGKATLPKSRWAWGATDSDRLQALSLQSGIPIIAEANRLASGSSGLYSEPTLFGALRGPNRPTGRFRFEAGALLQRPREFWRERLREPSEEALAPIERDDEPTIDDYAKTFAALPRALLPTIYSRATRRALAAYSSQRQGLILWGSLSDEERAAARGGAHLSLASLSTPTRERIEETLLESMLDSSGELVVPREPGQEAPREEFALRLALLGLGSPRPLSLWFEADVEEIFRAPWTMIAPGNGAERRGGAVWITDAEGAGIRFFIPRLEPR